MRLIMGLADKANRYIDTWKPWVMAKDEDKQELVQLVCTQGINMFRSLMIYLVACPSGSRKRCTDLPE